VEEEKERLLTNTKERGRKHEKRKISGEEVNILLCI
jgi:hypothetical protein